MTPTHITLINAIFSSSQAPATTAFTSCPKTEVYMSLKYKIKIYSILQHFIRNNARKIHVRNNLYPLLIS